MTKLTFRILLILISLGWITSTSLSAQTCTTGTLLYREDFRGNNVTDPDISPVDLIGGYSNIPFVTGAVESGTRRLSKYPDAGGSWWISSDHTFFGDLTRGYAMFINPAANQLNATIYEMTIDDLCPGAELNLSVWLTDICKPLKQDGTPLVGSKIELMILDATTNVVLTQSGEITLRRSTTQAAFGYDQYFLPILIPVGTSSIKFKVLNKEISTMGNDFAIDDIEVRFCANTVSATAKGSAAVDVPITSSTRQLPFAGSYINDAKFGPSLASYWIYSPTGDITNLTTWTILDTKPATAIANGATWTHNFTLLNPKVGYYRLVVGNPSNVLTSKCRAASEIFHVHK